MTFQERDYEEAHLFSNKMKYDENLSLFDLRLDENDMVQKSSILLELTKSAATKKGHTIYMFFVSDRLLNFVNNDLQSTC